jgi:transcriptional regulator with XRE-family HTH domain
MPLTAYNRRSVRPTVLAFSRRLREVRLAAGISQETLAQRAHVRRTFISRLERGIGNPSLAAIALLARGLECDVADLFTHDA